MKKSVLIGAGYALASILPLPAHADAATHEFKIISAETVPSDCGGGSCVDACLVKAKLHSLETSTSAISIYLQYVNPRLDYSDFSEKFSVLSFSFGPHAQGVETDPNVDHGPNISCAELKIEKVSVKCEETCGYVNVSVPEFSKIGLSAQKVEGE